MSGVGALFQSATTLHYCAMKPHPLGGGCRGLSGGGWGFSSTRTLSTRPLRIITFCNPFYCKNNKSMSPMQAKIRCVARNTPDFISFCPTTRGHSWGIVDQEGIEPSSKRGHQKLSTCLSLPKFSCYSKTRATNYNLIL